jgi:hypothetical protein
MKVSSSAVKALDEKETKKEEEIPILSLVPEEDEYDEDDRTKTGSFKLFSNPGDATSPKYSFTMGYVDGTQSIRAHIKWAKNVKKVLRGMTIVPGPAQYEMVQQMASGEVLSTFNEHIVQSGLDARVARALVVKNAVTVRNTTAGVPKTAAVFAARRDAAEAADLARPVDPCSSVMVTAALTAVVGSVCPYKALEKQKRFMRRKMRKPYDMKVRQYVNHLQRINTEELPALPPFDPNQSLSQDELLDIFLFGIPKSWNNEMTKQDFDPYRDNINLRKVVEFCERLESVEEFSPRSNKKKDRHSNNKSDKYKKSKYNHDKSKTKTKDGKWCDYHESNTHNTSECSVLNKLKESKKGGDKKNGKKDWKGKSDYAKKFTTKELNTLVKKASADAVKKVRKELNSVNKRKKDDDDQSVDSLHMLENKMADVDEQLKAFNFDIEDGEIST